MLTAPRMVRIERAVRPCLPITLPTSVWRHAELENRVFVAAHALHFNGCRLIHQGPRNLADQLFHFDHSVLGHDLAPDRCVQDWHNKFGDQK